MLRTIYNALTSKEPSEKRRRAFFSAIYDGDMAVVVKFVAKYGCTTYNDTLDDTPPLVYAAQRGRTEMVRYFLDHGAPIDAVNRNGDTPLSAAAHSEHLDTTRLLLERGANMNCRDQYGWSPLHTATGFDRGQTFRLLVEKGADLNAANNDGVTPLMHAVKCGRRDDVALLLDHGANMVLADKEGWTALDISRDGRNRDPEILKLLMDKMHRQAEQLEQLAKGTPQSITVGRPLTLKRPQYP